MKVGDLVRVRYREVKNDQGQWGDPYHGIVFETPDGGELCTWKMWCVERGKVHVLMPERDQVEVMSEK